MTPPARNDLTTPPWEKAATDSSSAYVPPPAYQEPTPSGGGMDFVTIALAILALIAVFGLIPLFIIVFRAWNGG
jgi:hypothetical protein